MIKLILSKLNEMRLQGKSTIPMARLELRGFFRYTILNSKCGFMAYSEFNECYLVRRQSGGIISLKDHQHNFYKRL